MRIQKYLAQCGVASRRKSEELIKNNEILINDQVAVIGQAITATCVVKYNGKVVKPQESHIYILLHKPCGYITTTSDEKNRPTVLDLVSTYKDERIYPVGRLDYNTSGLLLLTNDGDLAFNLTHPKKEVKKTYIVEVNGILTQQNLQKLRNGVYIDGDYKTKQANASIIKSEQKLTTLELTIKEGKNRQIRKMIASVGHKVITLKRISIEKLILGDLQEGKHRKLTIEEIEYLKKL